MEQFYHESFRTTKQFPMQLRLHQGVINYAVLEHWHRSMEIDYLIDCEVQLMVSGKKNAGAVGGNHPDKQRRYSCPVAGKKNRPYAG